MAAAVSSTDVLFYGLKGEFGEFSNFFPAPIELDGKTWPTTEHYFQAQKFHDEALQERIRTLTSPGAAAKEGRKRSNPLREDWERVKDDVMLTALRAKFTEHEDLKAVLLSTGERNLVEHTTNDSYWADGGDGSGRNVLGQLLVRLRSELRAAQQGQEKS
eukprot:TRINITY_DN16932_c0_g1_i1.p1 TRINITY_DN16932_c0_g1~~TRINITY_DN16932_c0_g1_i1.p1  ORF type:complete len:160 (+),score=39.82 TRINITY_DN16932_c0_g1_i1:257-736(+)